MLHPQCQTNPSITIAWDWEVPFYNVCKIIHILVSNFLKTSSGAHTSQKLPKKQTPSLASSVGTCHIAQQHVDGMLISPCRALVRSVKLNTVYGAIVWDPYLQQDIDCFDRVQRKGVRFITGDYKSRSPGCVTAMLASQNLSSLQGRRKKLRLAFLFKLVEGTVPAICAENYLTPQRPKRAIRLKSFSDHITNNILDSQVTNNTKCFRFLTF